MRRLGRLLLLTFLESFATICVERGVYFYTANRLGFSNARNLLLALVFGGAYAAGAMLSHPVCRRCKEKRLLAATLVGQVLVHLVLAGWPRAAVVYAGVTAVGLLNGMKWPVVESYVSAGWTPAQAARAVGRFNVCWAASVPLALIASGPLIAAWPRGLFLLPAVLNVVGLLLALPLPGSPAHLPADHPERLPASRMERLRSLLAASRWLMVGSYASMWVMAALMPDIFTRKFTVPVTTATALSGLVDVVRLAAFVALERSGRWHGRAGPLLAAMLLLPLGFGMVLFGPNLAAVLAGEAIFGAVAGMTYYAALYYAMVVKNASVDAGGAHEGLIGLGFALGPAAGLAGAALTPILGSQALGVAAGVAVVFVVCSLGAVRPMRSARSGPADRPDAGAPARAPDDLLDGPR